MFEVKVGRFSAFGVCFFFFSSRGTQKFSCQTSLASKTGSSPNLSDLFPSWGSYKMPAISCHHLINDRW